jgi:hypothetical protein
MSLLTEENLEESLSGDIPCEAYFPGDGQLCGLPSVARIRFACPCGLTWRGFVCKRCLRNLSSGHYLCLHCRYARGSFTAC